MTNQLNGFTHILKGICYSFKGLKAAWINEAAFRQEFVISIIAVLISFYLDINYIDRLLLIFSVVMVAIIELINSSIETAVDRVGSDYNELSARAKDISSSAVFVIIGLALFVWVIVLWQNYFAS
ncbi:Diacylglycerol kinase [Candidatus Hartigia pinicola]|nr:Diacylglycerol kinase [Candidatus Hartigia pinicola]